MRYARLLVAFVVVALLSVACTQAAPVPTPTKAAAAPTKAAEPTKPAAPATTKAVETTKAATAAPTAAPAKKVDFPAPGKSITLVLGFPAGGGVDIPARALVPALEKELGTQIQVVNKPGAGGQIGLTDVVNAKPDGYTIGGASLPPAIVSYLDPERKAVFNRKSFLPLALHLVDPCMVAVKSDSPYKTMKDLVDAAKANPEKIKAVDSGIGLAGHLELMGLERLTGAKFANVHTEGGPQSITALLGGHVDVYFDTIALSLPHLKSGDMRILGLADKQETKFAPEVKTMVAQGYPLYFATSRGYWAPTGTPPEIVDTLSRAFKTAINNDEHIKKMFDMGYEVGYLGPAEFGAHWDQMEVSVKPLVEAIVAERKTK